MIYKKFKSLELSALGMGCMRLPTLEKNDMIDMDETRRMIRYAFDNGINYFDTAWGYHDGNSEKAMGEILSQYNRETFYLATKFPGYDASNMTKVDEIFKLQLERCKTDYFDFYMFHNVCEANIDGYLDERYGIFDYLCKQKKKGKIRHLGFSTHGTLETMRRFIDAYGKAMEFCQIQLNWLDWDFQNAKAKVELLNSHNIPIWVMEPLRGGSLTKIASKYEQQLKKINPTKTLTQWAFEFLHGIPNVGVILSGMSNLEQLEQNIEIFKTDKPLTDQERSALMKISNDMTKEKTLPCTSCKYCTAHCPKGLDIPWLIELFNEHVYSEGGFIAPFAIRSLPDDKKPSACLGCKSCESVCPQNIAISKAMADFASKMKK